MNSTANTDRAQEEKKDLRIKSQTLLQLVKEDESRWIYKVYRVPFGSAKKKIRLKPGKAKAHREYLQQVKELNRI